MANIIISYNHQNEAVTKTLAGDIEMLNHTVWFDEELSGGQVWWDHILGKIRNCDIFVFVLSPEALNSTACQREYGYAADLGKPILPVMVGEGVSINLLPPALSEIQFVDYRVQDRNAALHLARALKDVPPAKPLPDPLPEPPETPISYLGNLTKQIETTSTLSYEEQSTLVVDLKRSLRDPEATDDARTLLERLRRRRDLFAAMAEEIDELLNSKRRTSSTESESQVTQKVKETLIKIPKEAGKETPGTKITQPPTTQHAPTDIRPTMTLRKRLICSRRRAFLVIIIGVAAIAIFFLLSGAVSLFIPIMVGLLAGAGGAIIGKNRQLIVSALAGAALGWFIIVLYVIVAAGFDPEGFALGGLYGAPTGAIFGTILGVIHRKTKKRP
jgi:hypothetical protein